MTHWIERLKSEGFQLQRGDYMRVRKGPPERLGWASHWHCYEGDAWAEARNHRNLNPPEGEGAI